MPGKHPSNDEDTSFLDCDISLTTYKGPNCHNGKTKAHSMAQNNKTMKYSNLAVKIFKLASILPSIFWMYLYIYYLIKHKQDESWGASILTLFIALGVYSFGIGALILLLSKILRFNIPRRNVYFFIGNFGAWLIIWFLDPFGILGFLLD